MFSTAFDINLFAGVAQTELHNRFEELMEKFNTITAFVKVLRVADPQPPFPIPPIVSHDLVSSCLPCCSLCNQISLQDSATITEGINDA